MFRKAEIMQAPIILNQQGLAEKLGMSTATIVKYRDKGMPYIKLSEKMLRFDLEEVLNWMKANDVRDETKL